MLIKFKNDLKNNTLSHQSKSELIKIVLRALGAYSTEKIKYARQNGSFQALCADGKKFRLTIKQPFQDLDIDFSFSKLGKSIILSSQPRS